MFGMKTKQKKKKEVRSDHEEQELLLCDKSPFIVAEAYRALRTNIVYSLPGSDCKCIALTSTGRMEGKSTNSINIAISFGQLGKKTLLMDADMRLPTVAQKMSLKRDIGLSDLLTGNAEWSEDAFHAEGYGIDVITAGTVSADPTRLLDSVQMKTLMAQLKSCYDYIFIDLPPVNTVTDALTLHEHVDGYLLLVRHNVVMHRAVREMLDNCRKGGAKILGFLYVDAEVGHKGYGKKYGYYGHGYGYDYGYGYGAGNAENSENAEK